VYKIIFYKDKNGDSEIEQYIKYLSSKRENNKECRVKFLKITSYIDLLSKYGLELAAPYIKHLSENIWELRPLRDRILFAYWNNNKFILLSQFVKKTQKTPKREIERAKRNLAEYRKRRDEDE